jgi:Ni/Fe-hydrogenase subunit HybB-like protein
VTWTHKAKAVMGPRALWAAIAGVAVGVAAFATGLAGGGAPRAYAALIANWLFFAGVAAGAVAFRALFRMIDAGWARPLAPLAGAQASFLPAASVLLLVIVAGARIAPWVTQPTGWLATPFLVLREVALNAALFLLAYRGLGRPGGARPLTRRTSVVYLLLFSVVLSVWAFDFVLGPAPDWAGNTLIGAYVFVGSFIAGAGVVTLLGVARGVLSDRQRVDAASLLLTLAIFWAYFFWSQYLTLWYANLPDEIVFALRRSVDGWGVVVVAVVLLVFAVPFICLIHPRGRRSPRVLGTVVVAQLVGLWLNCNLLVVPSLSAPGSTPFQLRDLLIALGMLGAFALSVAPVLQPQPAR